MDVVGSLLDILQKQTELTQEFSKNNSGTNLVSKNVIKSEGSTFSDEKTSSRLTSREKNKITEASEIISNIFAKKELRKTSTVQSSISEQKSNKNLEVTSKVGSKNISSNIIKNTKVSPKEESKYTKVSIKAIPKITRIIPKITKIIPKATKIIPKATKIIPKAIPKAILKITKIIPKATKIIPKAIPKAILKITKIIPKATKIIPKATKIIPKAIPKAIPKIIPKAIPKITKIIPKATLKSNKASIKVIKKSLMPQLLNYIQSLINFSKFEESIAKSSTLSNSEKGKATNLANIIISKFFDEQKKRQSDTKLGTLTSEKKSINESGLFSKKFNNKENNKENGESKKSGSIQSLINTVLGSTLLKKMFTRLLPKPIRQLPTKLKAFKTRLIKNLTPKPIRNLMARVKMAKRQISRLLKPTNIIKAAKTTVQNAAKGLSKNAPNIIKAAKTTVQNAAKSGIGKWVSSNVGRVVAATKSAASSMTVDAAKSVVRKGAENLVKSSGGMTKLLGKVIKAPVIGPIITAAFTAYDILKLKNQFSKGEINQDELQASAGKSVISAITQMIGTVGGGALGAAIGTLIPIPIVGTSLGAIAGSVGGAFLGQYLGELITDYIIPPKYTKSIGAFITNTSPPKDEMQDFIIKNGKVHKFSNKDELMGLKSGGAIDQFLQSKPKNDSYLRLVEIGLTTNSYLMAIANNTAIMAKGDKSNTASSPIIIQKTTPISDSSNNSYSSIENNRDGYMSSHYALG